MKSKSPVLLKALLLSTSLFNKYKYCKDKKKKGKIAGGCIAYFFLYAMLVFYAFATCVGYGRLGIIETVPGICALTISLLSFLFTFFKTNGYLFNFKEYDMLMALPFSPSTVAACKFSYMYIKSLPMYLVISLSVMAGYGMYAKPGFMTYPLWILLSLFVPVIPMLIAAFIGFLITKVSAGFKLKKLVQTILTFVFVIFCFSLRFMIEGIFRNDKVEDVLTAAAEGIDKACGIYLPAGWFTAAVTKSSLSDSLLLVGISLVLFELVFLIVGKNYRQINSALSSHDASGDYHMTSQKAGSVVNTVAFKEFRRMMGSTNYLVNVGMGVILAAIFGIVVLIFGFENVIQKVTQNAPLDGEMLIPAIPFIIYFFIGMMSTAACSPSLEGKNYWIVQSLPIDKKVLYRGKMLFNMYLTLPFSVFSTLCLCISAHVSPVGTVLALVLGIALCAFSTAWGCVCGIRFIKLEWENEIEVIKQGKATMIYMFPNMFINMGLIVLMVVLGKMLDHNLLTAGMILIVTLLAALSYLRAMSLAKKS